MIFNITRPFTWPMAEATMAVKTRSERAILDFPLEQKGVDAN